MKIIIKATQIDLTPSIHQYIEEKIGSLEKFLKRFDPELTEARVEVGRIKHGQRQGEIFRAEVNLRVNGKLLRVVKVEESLQAAIDFARDELAKMIRGYKDKEETKIMRGARSWKKFWRLSPSARFRTSKVGKIIKKKQI